MVRGFSNILDFARKGDTAEARARLAGAVRKRWINWTDRAFPIRAMQMGPECLRVDTRLASGPDLWRWAIGESRIDPTLPLLAELATGCQVVFDVGAWAGTHAMMLARQMPGGRVYAFEPDPSAGVALKANCRLNRVENVELVDLCVGADPGTSTLHSSGGRWGTQRSSLLEEAGGPPDEGEAIDVRVVTFDEFCISRDVWPDGLKIDIEGAEVFALRGLEQLVGHKHPWVVIELHTGFLKPEAADDTYARLLSLAKHATIIRSEDAALVGKPCPPRRPDCPGHLHLMLRT